MEKEDWAKIIMVFALLYIISWLIGYWIPFGSIIFMVIIFLIACCIVSKEKRGKRNLDNAYTILKEIKDSTDIHYLKSEEEEK